MNHRLAAIVVNGLLVALAVVSLGPLLWMLSVSFMQTGEAGHFPPPLLPAAPTLDNYRDLFVRAGMGRYLVNSFIVSTSVMLLSLLFNTMAGYAFAKLRFKGRRPPHRSPGCPVGPPSGLTSRPSAANWTRSRTPLTCATASTSRRWPPCRRNSRPTGTSSACSPPTPGPA